LHSSLSQLKIEKRRKKEKVKRKQKKQVANEMKNTDLMIGV